MKEYVIYKANDELVFIGNHQECSEFLGCSKESFYSRVSKLKNGKTQNPEYEIYAIED